MVGKPDQAGSVAAAVCRACVDGLPFDGAAMMAMASDQQRELLWASDPVITRLQELQFSFGEGPILDVHLSGRPLCIGDVADVNAARWPILGAELAAMPVRGIFTFPVAIGVMTIGVLELYRQQPGDLNPEDLTAVLRVVDVAAAALLALRSQPHDGAGDAIWLQGPGSDRHVHQATGMLIVQLGVSPEEAFARLRGYAFAHDRLIGAVANDIVANQLLLPE